jgi:hypothetical protein
VSSPCRYKIQARRISRFKQFGNEGFDTEVERLGRGVPEDLRCCSVPENHSPGVRLGDEHRVPDALEDAADAQVLGSRWQPSLL